MSTEHSPVPCLYQPTEDTVDASVEDVDLLSDGVATHVTDLEWLRTLGTSSVPTQEHNGALVLQTDGAGLGLLQLLHLALQLHHLHVTAQLTLHHGHATYTHQVNINIVECSGSGVELRTLDYENPGSNPGCGVKGQDFSLYIALVYSAV